jgi:hypothetical protein
MIFFTSFVIGYLGNFEIQEQLQLSMTMIAVIGIHFHSVNTCQLIKYLNDMFYELSTTRADGLTNLKKMCESNLSSVVPKGQEIRSSVVIE